MNKKLFIVVATVGLAASAFASTAYADSAPFVPRAASAQLASADVTAPVQRLNAALLAIMKSGQGSRFQQRYEALALSWSRHSTYWPCFSSPWPALGKSFG